MNDSVLRAMRERERVIKQAQQDAAREEKAAKQREAVRFGPAVNADNVYEQQFRKWADSRYGTKLSKKKPDATDILPDNKQYWSMRAQYQDTLQRGANGKEERKYGDALYKPYEHAEEENDSRDAYVRKFKAAPDTKSDAWKKWQTQYKYKDQYNLTDDEDKRRYEAGEVPYSVEAAEKQKQSARNTVAQAKKFLPGEDATNPANIKPLPPANPIDQIVAQTAKQANEQNWRSNADQSLVGRFLNNLRKAPTLDTSEGTAARKAYDAAAAAGYGFSNAATLGLVDRANKELNVASQNVTGQDSGVATNAQQQLAALQKNNPVAYTVGQIGGYAAPGIGAEGLLMKGAAPLVKAAGTSAAKQALIRGGAGAIAGAELTTAEDLIRQKPADELARDVLIGVAAGGVLDAGLFAGGNALKALKNVVSRGKSAPAEDLLTVAETLADAQPETASALVDAAQNGVRASGLPQARPIGSAADASQEMKQVDAGTTAPIVDAVDNAAPKIETKKSRIATTATMETDAPWEVAKEDMKMQPPTYFGKKIKYNPSLKNEASNKTSHIEVGDKYFEMPLEQRRAIIAHEVSHDITSDYLYNRKMWEDVVNSGAFGERRVTSDGRAYFDGVFGEMKVDEAFTEALAVYETDPAVLKARYPAAYDYIDKIKQEYAALGNETPSRAIDIGVAENGASKIEASNKIVDNAPPEMKLDTEPSDSLYLVDPTLRNTQADVTDWARRAYRTLVSGQAPLERAAKVQAKADAKAATLTDLTQSVRNASGTVDYIASRGLVNRAGDAVGDKSWKSVVDSVPKDKRSLFNEYRQNLHNVDRMSFAKNAGDKLHDFEAQNPELVVMSDESLEKLSKEVSPDGSLAKDYLELIDEAKKAKNKPVLDKTAEESAKRADELLAQHPEFKQASDAVNKFNDDFNKEWLVKSGLITQDQYDAMKKLYPNYIPTYRVEWQGLKGRGSSTASGGAIRTGKMVRAAKGATSEVVPLEDSFMENYNRTVRAVRKNELYLNLIEWAEKNPEAAKTYAVPLKKGDDIAKLGQGGATLDDLVDAVDQHGVREVVDQADEQGVRELNKRVYQLTAYRDGKPVTANITKEVYDALKNLSGGEMSWFGNLGRSLTNPFKAVTTGYNPLYIARNVLRDIPNAYVNSAVANPVKYVGLMGKAIKDIATRSNEWRVFQALGGKHTSFYSVEKGFRASNTGGAKNAVKRAVSATGEVTEALPRFTEYLAGIEKYGDTATGRKKAIQMAADVTVNFSRSGGSNEMRILNAWVPYLNAQVQGMDKFLRQMKKPSSVLKGAAVIGGPTMALYAWNKDNPHYKDLDNRTKDAYYLFPNLGNRDEKGYPKTFIRIPKSRELGAVWDVLERLARAKDEGLEEGFKGYGNTLATNFAFSNPSTDNIIATGANALANNKDFAGRSIVPEAMQDLEPQYQYDETTSGLAKRVAPALSKLPFVGDKLKSPKMTDYVLGQYGGFVADAAQAATTGQNAGPLDVLKKTATEPWRKAFTADPLYQNGVTSGFYDAKDKATTTAKTRNFVENIDSGASTPEERLLKEINDISTAISDLYKQERALQAQPMTVEERNAKSREIRQQITDLARQGTALARHGSTGSTTVYPAGVDDSKREAYDGLVRSGIPEKTLQAVYAGFAQLKPRDGNKSVTAKDRKDYLQSLTTTGLLSYDQYRRIFDALYPKDTD